MDLVQRLQTLARQLEANAPSQDSRRTISCPPFTALAELAEHGGPEGAHIASCDCCQAVLAAVRQQHSPVIVQQPVIVPDNSAPVTNITHELREYAARWFRMNQPVEDADLGGTFDGEGVLHLSLPEPAVFGRVRVRLVADEMPLPLMETEVTAGPWETSIALPEWNLHNVRIARDWIELVPA